MAGHAKKKNSRGPLISASQKNKQKKTPQQKKETVQIWDKTDLSQSALTLTATAKNTTVKGQQPDVEQWNKRTFFSHFYLRIIRFPELTECWKEQTILKQQNSKLHKTTQTMYKTLLKQKNWTTRPFTCNVSVSNVKSSDLKKQTKNKNGVRAFSHPLRSPSPNHPQLFWRQAG